MNDFFLEVSNTLMNLSFYSLGGLGLYLGKEYLLGRLKVEQDLKDILKHNYIVGQTGTGKTTFLVNKIHEYMKMGVVVFICYKDQLTAEEILNTISDEDKDEVVILDLSNELHYPSFNIFGEQRNDRMNEMYVNAMVETYKSLWGDSIGASSEDIFRMVGLAVAEMNVRTPLEIFKCISSEHIYYREELIKNIKNPVVRNFFIHELPDKLKNHSVMNPPRNKQRKIVASPILSGVLCQKKAKFSLEKELNNKKLIIANFNQEVMGAENASFMAGLFFNQLQIIGFTRKDKSKPIFVIGDEFQDYVNKSFITYLSQARSFNMSLTLAHQYTSQIPKEIKNAIDGNVANTYYFRVGKKDAREIKPFLDEEFDLDTLVNMEDYHCLSEILVNGEKTKMKKTKAPKPMKEYNNKNYIINKSKKYGTRKDLVEKEISERLSVSPYGKEKGGMMEI